MEWSQGRRWALSFERAAWLGRRVWSRTGRRPHDWRWSQCSTVLTFATVDWKKIKKWTNDYDCDRLQDIARDCKILQGPCCSCRDRSRTVLWRIGKGWRLDLRWLEMTWVIGVVSVVSLPWGCLGLHLQEARDCQSCGPQGSQIQCVVLPCFVIFRDSSIFKQDIFALQELAEVLQTEAALNPSRNREKMALRTVWHFCQFVISFDLQTREACCAEGRNYVWEVWLCWSERIRAGLHFFHVHFVAGVKCSIQSFFRSDQITQHQRRPF